MPYLYATCIKQRYYEGLLHMQINLMTYLFAILLIPIGYDLPICVITSYVQQLLAMPPFLHKIRE